MKNLFQNSEFFPSNNIDAINDIVKLSQEVEIELGIDASLTNDGGSLSEVLLDKYGSEYIDANVDDFHDFDPESINNVDKDEDFESVLGGVSEEGLEALAFYKSFRFFNSNPAKGKWGIFFIKPLMVNLIRELSFETNQPITTVYEALTRMVYVHELYHFKVDAFILQRESISLQSTYLPYRKYVSKLNISDWWEEAVANHYGLGAILRSTSRYQCPNVLQDSLVDIVFNSPGAYACGVNKNQQSSYRCNLSDQINSSIYSAVVKGPSGHQMPSNLALLSTSLGLKLNRPRDRDLINRLNLDKCPIYWITPSVVNKYFPKNLQSITIQELENSFVSKYLRGSVSRISDHKYYKIDNGEEVKMPNPHLKNLKKHEMKNILFKAGLTPAQFFKERSRTKIWREGVPRNPFLKPRGTANS